MRVTKARESAGARGTVQHYILSVPLGHHRRVDKVRVVRQPIGQVGDAFWVVMFVRENLFHGHHAQRQRVSAPVAAYQFMQTLDQIKSDVAAHLGAAGACVWHCLQAVVRHRQSAIRSHTDYSPGQLLVGQRVLHSVQI